VDSSKLEASIAQSNLNIFISAHVCKSSLTQQQHKEAFPFLSIFMKHTHTHTANDIVNGNDEHTPIWDGNYGLPFFDNTTTKRDVTATVGQSAKLHCVVRNLGDRAVSKIKAFNINQVTKGN